MLLKHLETLGITKDLEALGYQPTEIFGSLSEEAQKTYLSYTWKKVACSVDGIKNAYVIHAVPPTELIETNPWEEWFIQYEKPEHHVLFLSKNDQCTEEIMIPADDVDHPAEIAGKYWYYYCATESAPYLK